MIGNCNSPNLQHTALAVITGSSQIFVATSLERPRILAISTEIPLADRAFVWEVASSTSNEIDAFKGPFVLLAVDKDIHRMGVGKAMKVCCLFTFMCLLAHIMPLYFLISSAFNLTIYYRSSLKPLIASLFLCIIYC